MNDCIVQVGDLVIDDNGTGYCYEIRSDSIFIKWINKRGSIDCEQYWLNGEVEDFIKGNKWRVVRRKYA